MSLREKLAMVYDPRAIFYHWETVYRVLKGDRPVPVCMDIDLSNSCNHNCIWCHSEKVRRAAPGLMREAFIEKLLTSLAELGCKAVIFSGGGEPLVNRSIVHTLPVARDAGLRIALITNGGLLTPELAKLAVRTCSWIRLSIDAGSPGTHQNLHRPKSGTYREVMSNVKRLADFRRERGEATPTIGVGFLIHPENVAEIYSAAAQTKAAGADYIYLRPVAMPGVSLADQFGQIVEQQNRAYGELEDESFVVFGAKAESVRTDIVQRPKDYERCLGYQLAGVVGATGDVYLCCLYREAEWSFGRLPATGLADLTAEEFWRPVWCSQKREEVVQRLDVRRCLPCKQDRYNSVLWRLHQNPTEREDIQTLMQFCFGQSTMAAGALDAWLQDLSQRARGTAALAKSILDFFDDLGSLPKWMIDQICFL